LTVQQKLGRAAATLLWSAVPVIALTGWACAPAAGVDAKDAPPAVAQTAVPEAALRPRPAPGHAWVIFGTDTVDAEVARTPEEREMGLMGRQELPDGTGMLFVFEDSQPRSFWMQNTYVPLDIAFLDVSLRVVDIQQMEPLTTDPHDSAGPAMFALEVPKGWFAAHGITAGAQATIEFGP
jgi:uncharacterized membrane protein (UPF0127 family)